MHADLTGLSAYAPSIPGMLTATSSLNAQEVAAIGRDGQVWVESGDGTNWSAWTITAPGTVQKISATTDGNGHSIIFALGTDNQVWEETYTATSRS
jgi:hypothetical protein